MTAKQERFSREGGCKHVGFEGWWFGGSRWAPHLQLNAVNDGDIVFMHQQSRNNRAAGPSPNFATHYFTPGDSDRCCSGMGFLFLCCLWLKGFM